MKIYLATRLTAVMDGLGVHFDCGVRWKGFSSTHHVRSDSACKGPTKPFPHIGSTAHSHHNVETTRLRRDLCSSAHEALKFDLQIVHKRPCKHDYISFSFEPGEYIGAPHGIVLVDSATVRVPHCDGDSLC